MTQGYNAGQPIETALAPAAHALINHAGLPGVPAAEAFTAGVHATTNHAGITGVGNLSTAPGTGVVDHTTLNHTGVPGVGGLSRCVFILTGSTVAPNHLQVPGISGFVGVPLPRGGTVEAVYAFHNNTQCVFNVTVNGATQHTQGISLGPPVFYTVNVPFGAGSTVGIMVDTYGGSSTFTAVVSLLY